MTNVALYLESPLGVDEIIELAPDRVVVATGARWTNMLYSLDGNPGRHSSTHPQVFTPDDIAAGRLPEGPTLVFDFDNYYMGGVLTEHLAAQGMPVTYVTPAGQASAWTIMTNELPLVHRALAQRGVRSTRCRLVKAFDGETATLAHIFTGEESRARLPLGGDRRRCACRVRELHRALAARAPTNLRQPASAASTRIGDALAPGAIAHAVHSGHRLARELGTERGERPYRRDTPIVSADPGPAWRDAAE